MSLSVGALRGTGSARGIVDHRLARRMLISQVKKGRLPLDQVCDAHPELIRAARNVGTQTTMLCPICEESDLKLVTYVFGHGLSPQGRCVSTAKEMRQLNTRDADLERVCRRGMRGMSLAPPAADPAGRRSPLVGLKVACRRHAQCSGPCWLSSAPPVLRARRTSHMTSTVGRTTAQRCPPRR